MGPCLITRGVLHGVPSVYEVIVELYHNQVDRRKQNLLAYRSSPGMRVRYISRKFVDICYSFVHGKSSSWNRHVQYISIEKN